MSDLNFIIPSIERKERIMAIDPANEQSAYVIWDGETVIEKGIVPNEQLSVIIFTNDYDKLAIEMVASYGMPVGRTVFETCVWIGRFYELSPLKANNISLVYRKDVKMHHCVNMRAKDSNIRQALIDKYGKTGTKKEPNPIYQDSSEKMRKDIWAAFAIATFITEK